MGDEPKRRHKRRKLPFQVMSEKLYTPICRIPGCRWIGDVTVLEGQATEQAWTHISRIHPEEYAKTE